MTLTPFTVYLIMQADNVCGLFVGLTILSGSAGLILGIARAAEDYIAKTRVYVTVATIFVIGLLGIAAMPSTKTLAAMFVVPALANSDFIKKDAPELYDLAIGKLKEQLKPTGVEK